MIAAMALARREGIRVGLLKLLTAWPFPEKAVRALAGRVPLFIVPEINYGQMSLEVERCAAGRTRQLSRRGRHSSAPPLLGQGIAGSQPARVPSSKPVRL